MTTPTEHGHWWNCPLPVEDLARQAVSDACAATTALSLARNGPAAAQQATTTAELIAASFATMELLQIDGRRADSWAPLSGFVQAADGWLRVHANYPHHVAALTSALGISHLPDAAKALRQKVYGLPADAVQERVLAAGGIATRVRTPDEWATHPQALATADSPWFAVAADSPRRWLPSADLPLAGVRVLDLTRVIAGPTCSQLLACLGADVLRVDPPQRPELLDQYLSNGMGKRSVAIDFGAGEFGAGESGAGEFGVAAVSRPSAAERVRQLLPDADVVLVGYRPGSLQRFGLDPQSLRSDYPHLVVGSLSAWGEVGPWGNRAGFDSIVQAATGIAVLCADASNGPDSAPGSAPTSGPGSAQWRPGALPVQALDHASGYRLAAGVMSLLANASGGLVRVSLLGAANTLLALPRQPQSGLDPDVEGSALAGSKIAGGDPESNPAVTVSSPHGTLRLPPPPLLLDGQHIARDVGGYAAATPAWLPIAPV